MGRVEVAGRVLGRDSPFRQQQWDPKRKRRDEGNREAIA
jgi:hypothetical protein